MEPLKKTLPSGAVLEASICSFDEGKKLFKTVTREMETIKLDIGDMDFSSLTNKNADISSEMVNTMKNIVSRLISSDEIESCLWPCLGRATIDKIKITNGTFEDVEVRGDYIIVLKEILIFNMSPFIGSLISMLKALPKRNIKDQK